MARSRITVGSPNAPCASDRALRSASGKRRGVRDQPHAAPAAAGDRLDHHGEADLFGFRQHHGVALVRALIAGHAGHAGLLHDLLGAGLVAHRLDRFRRRPDEDQPGVAAGLRKILVLGEEAVAGMHRAGAAGLCRGDDRVDLADRIAPAAPRRSAPPDPPRAHAARRDRHRNRPRPRHSRAGARCA